MKWFQNTRLFCYSIHQKPDIVDYASNEGNLHHAKNGVFFLYRIMQDSFDGIFRVPGRDLFGSKVTAFSNQPSQAIQHILFPPLQREAYPLAWQTITCLKMLHQNEFLLYWL